MINELEFQSFLSHTGSIIDHQKELKLLRGETFNIFSILRMELKENDTHSAFLGELLNPNGSHVLGRTFLNLFLNTVCENIDLKGFDAESSRVKLEHGIGRRDDVAKKGGRIDIFIWDKMGVSISIENKIYALDQNAQVQRYFNYNTDMNTVLYLTLEGDEPSVGSKGSLVSGIDFYNISYNEDIVNWLELCVKESANQPVLRETIKQYILLIKKLTSTMDDKHEKQLVDLMLNNFEASQFIASNLFRVSRTLGEKVRLQVIDILIEKLKRTEFTVIPGNTTEKRYSQIWINKGDAKISFGVESFREDGHLGGHIFVGLFVDGGIKDKSIIEDHDLTGFSSWWIDHKLIEDYENVPVNMGNSELLRKLNDDKESILLLSEHIAQSVLDYIEDRKHIVK